MIESSESLLLCGLLNLFFGLLLYCVATLYRLTLYKRLKLGQIGNYFGFLTPLIFFSLIFLKVPNLIFFGIAFLGSLGLIYDFFQNYKKCYLCSCISLLLAHLCVITLVDISIAPKLQFLIYLFFANFCFFFLCFGRFEAFKTTFFISLFATLLTFIPSWIDFANTRNVLIGYLILYAVLYFLAFLFASGRLIAYLTRIAKAKWRNIRKKGKTS